MEELTGRYINGISLGAAKYKYKVFRFRGTLPKMA